MTRRRRSIIVLGKEPIPGRVKTRLSPPLDPRQAARLAGAMLQDTLALTQSIDRAEVILAHPPLDNNALLASIVPTSVARLIDHASDLGLSMDQACATVLAGGAGSVVLIGADLPNLPGHLIEEAFSILDRCENDVLLGPAVDGGYYLVGLAKPQPSLFTGIDWGTAFVLDQTMERAREAGLHVHLLAPWQDVDEPADLEWLMRELAHAPSDVAPATRAVLANSWPSGTAVHVALRAAAQHPRVSSRLERAASE